MTAGEMLPKRTPWDIQRAVVFALFVRELKTRFGGRWLGVFWTLFEPTAHLVILLLIFGFTRHRVLAGVEYPVFLLTGLVPFFLFKNLAVRSMESIDSNRGLFGYRQVKPIDPIVSRALLEISLYSSVYLIMLGSLGWLGLTVWPDRPLELIFVSGVLVIAGVALGMLFAIVTNEVPEVRSIVRIVFMPLYIMSGVIFPVSALPQAILPWLLWNPILHAIEISRGYFFEQYHVIPQVSLNYLASFSLITLTLALVLYRVRRLRLLSS